ncbi:heme/hemin ABC transporter substrate-binding protein [Tateyamaria omphalii]|uniref:Hemin ABC transporter substrate-binding protein n=1 Tax=Tateyamaria omphalii TaxID=299262 RepID=A0A1P8N188_9RHOB|nr:ABC transporter substrate-binding protein [Tateyamaria omphalii]APX14076.1 hemin ABC transporter substrate-binding protein [Tateyamaria omphalii]
MDRRAFIALSLALAATHPTRALAASDAQDVIALGGDVTEIIYALDQQHRLLARDATSTFPPQAQALPDVGYMRRLSAEGVLSFAPSLILSAEGAGPPEVIDLLRAASVDYVEVPEGYDATAISAKIEAVGAALDVTDKAKVLAEQTATALEMALARAKQTTGPRKRVMFILSTQGGRVMASGTDTGADGIIGMAGGTNAISQFEGYKPLSDEAASAAAPDVILMMDRSGDHASTDDELFSLPALQATPAAQNRAVVRMDGLFLLGFGPRTAGAVTALNRALYPPEPWHWPITCRTAASHGRGYSMSGWRWP